jgi:leucyl aminopeptidase
MIVNKKDKNFKKIEITNTNSSSLGSFSEYDHYVTAENIVLFINNIHNVDIFKTNFSKFLSNLKGDVHFDLDEFKNILSKNINFENFSYLLVDMIEQYCTNSVWLKTSDKKEIKVFITSKNSVQLKKYIEIAQEKTFVRKLQDLPSNIINPVTMLEQIKKQYGNIPGLKISSLSQKELIKKGMNLMVGVNLGSDIDCQLVVLEYNGNPKSKEKIAYVGKGVCFDSGGYSLKPSNYMTGMKYDMSGAAIVCTSVALAAKHKLKTNLVAVAGLVMNKISAKAQLQDDVVTSYSGKTVEVGNTDAEGRLVLADCITYAVRDMKATKILDVATLTGCALYSLGNQFTAAMCTNQKDWEKLQSSSYISNENIWRLPFHNSYKKFIESKIADYTNDSPPKTPDTINAGMLLNEFCEGRDFIHLDVAGTADIDSKATAVMVKTLLEFAK